MVTQLRMEYICSGYTEHPLDFLCPHEHQCFLVLALAHWHLYILDGQRVQQQHDLLSKYLCTYSKGYLPKQMLSLNLKKWPFLVFPMR